MQRALDNLLGNQGAANVPGDRVHPAQRDGYDLQNIQINDRNNLKLTDQNYPHKLTDSS
jgi:hypothetical protein